MDDWPTEILLDDLRLARIRANFGIATEIYNIFASDPDGMRFWMPNGTYKSPEDVFMSYVRRPAWMCMYGIWSGDRFLGEVGFSAISQKHNTAKIGYWLRTDARGRGIIMRMIARLEQMAFAEHGIEVIYIECNSKNAVSRHIAEKNGYILDGVVRGMYQFADGSRHDECIYSKLKSEWEKENKNA